jgi:hypothetical protein
MEEWRAITGYEGFYEVSNLGRVRSVCRYVNSRRCYRLMRGRILRQTNDKDGYKVVTLCKNNIKATARVHRLVAETFIGNPNNLPSINHKDENKANNNVENLEFCTVYYNNTYNNKCFRGGAKRRKRIVQLLDGVPVNEWVGVAHAGKTLGISQKNISSCLTGKRHLAGGYGWRYC